MKPIKEKARESGTFAYPARLGLRIAHLSRISNAEAHAKLHILIGVEETQ